MSLFSHKTTIVFEISFSELKSKCWQGHNPSRGSRGDPISCFLQILLAAGIPCLVAASLQSLPPYHTNLNLPISFKKFIYFNWNYFTLVITLVSLSEVAQSCLTLCDPMDCSLPGSSVHGIFQAILLEWIAISFSRRSSQPRDQTWVSHIVDRHFTIWATREV